VLLLAHVDKGTSRARKPEGSEGYSGSTAWHNSVRSRLYMTRAENGSISLEHQKSNFGKLRDPIALTWPDGGLPMLVGDVPQSGIADRVNGRIDDSNAMALLRMIAEFETREQYCSPAPQARNNVYSMLKSEPDFQDLKLNSDATKRIVNQCQRAKWLESLEYRGHGRVRHRWTVTTGGCSFAGLSLPHTPTSPHIDDVKCADVSIKVGCPTPPHMQGGMGGAAHTIDGASEAGHE
jgi:hypothetical protein